MKEKNKADIGKKLAEESGHDYEDVNPEELRQWREVEEEHGYHDHDIYERDYR